MLNMKLAVFFIAPVCYCIPNIIHVAMVCSNVNSMLIHLLWSVHLLHYFCSSCLVKEDRMK
jgi:hypothetical protein